VNEEKSYFRILIEDCAAKEYSTLTRLLHNEGSLITFVKNEIPALARARNIRFKLLLIDVIVSTE